MGRFHHHVFVCGNERPPGDPRGCCAARGGCEVRDALKAELKRRGLSREIRANGAGCLDACAHGPTVVVYPEGVWYGGVTRADVPEIVERHLVGGEPVERLVIRAFRRDEGVSSAAVGSGEPPRATAGLPRQGSPDSEETGRG